MTSVITEQVRETKIDARRYLLVKAKGGMGNRLLCAASGLLYAQLSNRQAVIDWTDTSYSDDGSNVFSRYFCAPKTEAVLPVSDGCSVYPPVWEGFLRDSMAEMIDRFDPDKHSSLRIGRKYSVQPADLARAEDVVVLWSYSDRVFPLRRHLRQHSATNKSESVDDILRRLMQNRFKLHPSILAQVQSYRAANWRPRMIGLHLRCTDRTTDVPQALKHVRRILEREPEAGLFLATDNRQTLEAVTRELPNTISTEKWYPDDGSAMHQNDACPSRFENGVEALVDMRLLAECDYLVYPGRSTFSYVSALWSQAPARQLIDVDRYNPKVRLKRWLRRRFE